MVIETKTTVNVKCDNCGKEQSTEQVVDQDYEFYYFLTHRMMRTKIPKGWYFLERVHVEGYRSKPKKKNRLYICEDPQFCCKKCLMEFLNKQITDKIK